MDTFSKAVSCSYEKYKQMILDVQMGGLEDEEQDQLVDPLIMFPTEISMIRSYVFAISSGESNKTDFGVDNFVGSLARYGIENPVPCISYRIQLYGMQKTMMELLEQMEDKYGKLRLKIHTKRYSQAVTTFKTLEDKLKDVNKL